MVKKKIPKAQGPGIISTHSQKHPAESNLSEVPQRWFKSIHWSPSLPEVDQRKSR